MITRQNYEIWFMDYADGNLTPEDKAKVEAFLLVHQDLATEFEALELIVAPVADVQFDHKSALKRTENEVAIHAENVEVFVVLELDKELNHQAQQALNDYFVAHPQYAHLRDEYAHTLLPVPQLVYENKAGLKKKRGIVRPLWYAIPVAAAASVALFFIFSQPSDSDSNGPAQANIGADTLKNDNIVQNQPQIQPNNVDTSVTQPLQNLTKNNLQPTQTLPAPTPFIAANGNDGDPKKSIPADSSSFQKNDVDSLPSVLQKDLLAPNEQIARTITDPGNGDSTNESLASTPKDYQEPVTRRSGIIDLNKKETWLAFAEKGITAVSGKQAEIVSEKTEARKSFKFKVGGFEISRSKQR